MCHNVLENNWAAREVLDLSTMTKHPSLEWIPDWMWRLNLKVMERFFLFVTVGLYDPPVRELMGYTWSARQEWLHRRFGNLVHLVTKLTPKRMTDAPTEARWLRPSDRPDARQMRRWCTRRRATCRRSGTATTESITARSSTPCSRSTPAVEIAQPATVLRIREPARLHRRIAPEYPARIAAEIQPMLVFGTRAQAGIA